MGGDGWGWVRMGGDGWGWVGMGGDGWGWVGMGGDGWGWVEMGEDGWGWWRWVWMISAMIRATETNHTLCFSIKSCTHTLPHTSVYSYTLSPASVHFNRKGVCLKVLGIVLSVGYKHSAC